MKRPSPASMADSPDFPPPAPPNHRMKKTRELPNLSDCNCCNRHINSTNPKNGLQILASEWRIVLLCKCCYSLVESSQYCSYCLTRVSSSSMESFHECKRCRRRVHKACASMFPFGSGNGNNCCDDFSVCFDCWVPKLIENDYKARVLGSKIKSKVAKTGCDLTNSLGSSGVCDSQDMGRGEDALNDVHVVAQKKVAVALEAKEKAFNKVMDATKAIAVASRAVGLVSVDRGGDQQGSAVDVDAQLAFRLHRAMNSSPRISRNSCLLNTQCEDVPEVDGLGLQAAIDPSCSSKPSNAGGDGESGCPETIQAFEHKCARIQDEKQDGDLDGCLITYSRKGRASLEAKGKKEPDSSQRTRCRRWSSGAVKIKEEHDCPLRTYRRRLSKVERCKLELGYYT
ncbi:uncharacterized protein LOC110736641 [Chenopodium quinoa]|uniref:Uncharacterized protein n=1 Tax=Chenopodium quinoa TaxID=63459 RepID=A0A803KND2_CHEQI|nr:uncharacterized protein LOC110736641 [Chenopodium quinoa]XP_021772606.1 uncharacterized protein LOC110736641 [Chenopodium quinoa]XP_021772607.1 uncharacterized protein LOC110736641 [Chenopodium quinoa]XP_021772608.1 uncharacterized protein LOC110736641 [Chenopodium quinoa]